MDLYPSNSVKALPSQVWYKVYPFANAAELKQMQREVRLLEEATRSCSRTSRILATSTKEKNFCVVMQLYEETVSDLLARSPSECLTALKCSPVVQLKSAFACL